MFCGERGLQDWQFYEWKKRVREAEAVKFVPVEVTGPEKAAPVADRKAIEVRLGRGRSLMVEPGFGTHHLHALLAVLEAEA